MMRSLFSGVSGLRNHQTRMDVIGNNISNVNTLGFKKSTTTFQDLFSQTITPASGPTGTTGGTNAKQIGLGAAVGAIAIRHTPGSTQYTGAPLDVSIEGDGFFIVRSPDGTFFTRSGNFTLDRDGFLISGPGNYVQAYGATWRKGTMGYSTVPDLSKVASSNFGTFKYVDGSGIVTANSGTYSLEVKNNPNIIITPLSATITLPGTTNPTLTYSPAMSNIDANGVYDMSKAITSTNGQPAVGEIVITINGSPVRYVMTGGPTLTNANVNAATPFSFTYVCENDTSKIITLDMTTVAGAFNGLSSIVAPISNSINNIGVGAISQRGLPVATIGTQPANYSIDSMLFNIGNPPVNTITYSNMLAGSTTGNMPTGSIVIDGTIYSLSALKVDGTGALQLTDADVLAGLPIEFTYTNGTNSVSVQVSGTAALTDVAGLVGSLGTHMNLNNPTIVQTPPQATGLTLSNASATVALSNGVDLTGLTAADFDFSGALVPGAAPTGSIMIGTNMYTLVPPIPTNAQAAGNTAMTFVYEKLPAPGETVTLNVTPTVAGTFDGIVPMANAFNMAVNNMAAPTVTPYNKTQQNRFNVIGYKDDIALPSIGDVTFEKIASTPPIPTPGTFPVPNQSGNIVAGEKFRITLRDGNGSEVSVFEYVAKNNVNMSDPIAFKDFEDALAALTVKVSNNDQFVPTNARGDVLVDKDKYFNVSVDQKGAIIAQLRDDLPANGGVPAMAKGTKVILGFVTLATFSNTEGLQKVGVNLYAQTPNSGTPSYNLPGATGVGTLSPSTLEMSNVDLSEEMVDMIITQRGFQANSRTITTSDQILEELVNLKR